MMIHLLQQHILLPVELYHIIYIIRMTNHHLIYISSIVIKQQAAEE